MHDASVGAQHPSRIFDQKRQLVQRAHQGGRHQHVSDVADPDDQNSLGRVLAQTIWFFSCGKVVFQLEEAYLVSLFCFRANSATFNQNIKGVMVCIRHQTKPQIPSL